MRFDEKRIVSVYARLIGLYPRAFRSRFGEAIERTFRDICNEQKLPDGTLRSAFVISAFADAFLGIARERSMEAINMTLNSVFNRIAASVLAGMVLTLPFVAAEWVYSGGFPHGVPFAIFNVLFIEASVFAYLAISVFRTPRTAPVANWILPLIAKTAAMIILASSWVFIVADQMPCFLGGRGC